MELFHCTVRLAGQVSHEVPRFNVTEREMQLLREIHGNDGVVHAKRAKDKAGKDVTVNRTDKEEMLMLAKAYGLKRVEDCFKVKLDDFDAWMQEQRDILDREADAELERNTRPPEAKGKQQAVAA